MKLFIIFFTNRWVFGLPFHIINVERQAFLNISSGLGIAIFVDLFNVPF